MSFGLSLSLTGHRRGNTSPVTDPAVASIAADSWQATYTSPPASFDPVASPKYIVVSRAGYDATGGATTIVDNLPITTRIRQVYPNQTLNTTDQVATTEYIYANDVISGVTNNATLASPKPVANWLIPDRRVVGNSLHLELSAYHRDGIACVIFSATDTVTTVTQTVSAQSVMTDGGADKFALVGYKCDLDITTLAAGAITVNAKVYPRFGVAASINDSSASAVAREFSPRYYTKDTTKAATPYYAYVKTTGNDSTGVLSQTAATASATPFLTFQGAINAIKASSATGNVVDGVVVRLGAGTFGLTANAPAGVYQTAAEVVVERDPGDVSVTQANCIFQVGTSNWAMRLLYIRFRNLTIDRPTNNTFSGLAGGQFVLENCLLDDHLVNSQMTTNYALYINGLTVSNCATSLLNAGALELRLVRGLSIASGSAIVEDHNVHACNIPVAQFSTGARTGSGRMITCSYLREVPGSSILAIAGSADVDGVAIVQNMFEYIDNVSNPALRVSADAELGNTNHVIIWHNTFAGFDAYGRWNTFYDEATVARTHKLISIKGNIISQLNTKSDIFHLDGTRTGNFPIHHGVGCTGNMELYQNANAGSLSFGQKYAGFKTVIGTSNTTPNNAAFTNYQGTTAGPVAGAGGGDYHIGLASLAKGIVPSQLVAFDLDGTARTATNNDAGAYVAA